MVGIFPVSFVKIVNDLKKVEDTVENKRRVSDLSIETKTASIPVRPASLDASMVAALKNKSLPNNSVAPINEAVSPARPPPMQAPDFSPPPPPRRPDLAEYPLLTESDMVTLTPPSRTKKQHNEVVPQPEKASPPKRPAAMKQDYEGNTSATSSFESRRETAPSRPPSLGSTLHPGQQNERTTSPVPSRPPPLDSESIVILRERSKSLGKVNNRVCKINTFS